MALTPRRWLAALMVVLLACMAAVLPPGTARGFIRYLPWGWYINSRREPDSLVQRHNLLLGRASFAGEQLVLATVRDSVLAQSRLIHRSRVGAPQLYRLRVGPASPRRPAGGTGTVARAVEPAVLRAALDSSWSQLPRRDPSAWTLVALAEAPLRLKASGHEADLTLPDGGEPILHGAAVGGGCVLVLDASRTAVPAAPQVMLERLAPCRWQAEFGAPSDSVAAWLGRQGWSSAYPLRWWLNRWGEVEVLSGRRTQVLADTGAWGDSARAVVDWALSWGSVDAAACYRGAAPSCLRLFREPLRRWWAPGAVAEETSIPTIRRSRAAGALVLAGLLDDVLHAVGPERFHAFWTSNLSADSALAVALQQPLAPWLMARVERRLGGKKAEPILSPASAGLSLVLAGAFVGAALLASARRGTP